MSPQALTLSGLALDLLGFVLLLREWWLAFFHENARLAAGAAARQTAQLRSFHQGHVNEAQRAHLEATARMQDEMSARSAEAGHRATLGARRRVFIAAAVLIVAGSLLQIAGALPASLLLLS